MCRFQIQGARIEFSDLFQKFVFVLYMFACMYAFLVPSGGQKGHKENLCNNHTGGLGVDGGVVTIPTDLVLMGKVHKAPHLHEKLQSVGAEEGGWLFSRDEAPIWLSKPGVSPDHMHTGTTLDGQDNLFLQRTQV